MSCPPVTCGLSPRDAAAYVFEKGLRAKVAPQIFKGLIVDADLAHGLRRIPRAVVADAVAVSRAG